MENVINDASESITGKSLKEHKWSYPLAVALKATGSVLNGISNIGGIPVAGIVGGALQMGASLFEKDIHDYHKETESRFDEMDASIKQSTQLSAIVLLAVVVLHPLPPLWPLNMSAGDGSAPHPFLLQLATF